MRFEEAVYRALAKMEGALSSSSMPTWRSHGRKLIAYFKPDFELADLRPQIVQGWVNAMKATLKPASVRHMNCMLQKVWAEQEEETPELPSPWRKVKLPKRNEDKRECRPEVFDQMVSHLQPEQVELVVFDRETLLRRAEVMRLKPADFTFEVRDGRQVGTVKIHISKTGKGRKVMLTERAAAIAKARIKACKEAGHIYLFGDQDPDRVKAGARWCQKYWYPLAKRLGVTAHFHGLRHLGARSLWAIGGKVEAISRMLGHSTIAQTEHYLSIGDEAQWGVVLLPEATATVAPVLVMPAGPARAPEPAPTQQGWGYAPWGAASKKAPAEAGAIAHSICTR